MEIPESLTPLRRGWSSGWSRALQNSDTRNQRDARDVAGNPAPSPMIEGKQQRANERRRTPNQRASDLISEGDPRISDPWLKHFSEQRAQGGGNQRPDQAYGNDRSD